MSRPLATVGPLALLSPSCSEARTRTGDSAGRLALDQQGLPRETARGAPSRSVAGARWTATPDTCGRRHCRRSRRCVENAIRLALLEDAAHKRVEVGGAAVVAHSNSVTYAYAISRLLGRGPAIVLTQAVARDARSACAPSRKPPSSGRRGCGARFNSWYRELPLPSPRAPMPLTMRLAAQELLARRSR